MPDTNPTEQDLRTQLQTMIEEWQKKVNKHFDDAELESPDLVINRREFLQDGAICIFNCISDIQRLLNESEENDLFND